MTSLQPEDESVRIHIRQLLFCYAKKNLTVDYVQWTENAVSELLSQCLREVPVSDPASLWLPQDPFDTLKQRYKLSELTAFEERWQTNSHALALIKESLGGRSGTTRSEKAPLVDDYDVQTSGRMSPVLTMRAIRETHRFPPNASAIVRQETPFSVAKGTRVENEDLDQVPLQMDKILDTNWKITSSNHHAVRVLLKDTLGVAGRASSRLDWWLYAEDGGSDTVSPFLSQSDSPFVPLFPRKSRPGYIAIGEVQERKEHSSFAELPSRLLPPIPTENLEQDLFNDDMRIIDDWGAFPVSSPSTLRTLTSSQEDRKIDLLFHGSSPNTDPHPVEALEAAKMEIVQIPRSRRLGGQLERKLVTGDHSFSSFIVQTLSGRREQEVSDIGSWALPTERVSSLAGQASCSVVDPPSTFVCEEDDDGVLRDLYATIDPKDFWHSESLDEKHMMLMEVPTLPAPSIHAPGPLFLPTKFSDFLPAPEDGLAVHRFLKKVKGLQPLRLQLSWIAFTTNEPLPSDAQIIGVKCFTEPELLMSGAPVQAVKELIDNIDSDFERQLPDTAALFRASQPSEQLRGIAFGCLPNYGPDMMLTRLERRRRAGESDPEPPEESSPNDEVVDMFTEIENQLEKSSDQVNSGIPAKFSQVSCAKEELPTPTSQTSSPPRPNTNTTGPVICQLPPYTARYSVDAKDTSTAVARRANRQTPGNIKLRLGVHLPGPSTAWHEANVITYARLRLKTVSAPMTLPESPLQLPAAAVKDDNNRERSRNIPADVFNHTTIRLPEKRKEISSVHRYLASIVMLQKKTLVRVLRDPDYSVELVERDTLGGADLIIDPFTGVVYASLFSLPSQCEQLISKISKLSWSFQRLIVILEGYPPSCANKTADEVSEKLFPYTPPVLKAIKKLRRGVDMAEAVQEKSESAVVLYAFPSSIYEAASITRHIGDLAEAADQGSGVWHDRMWLDEINEDEEHLSMASGMNSFIAAVILCQVTLDEFIAMSPEQRQHIFAPYVGTGAIASFNEALDQRIAVMQSSDHMDSPGPTFTNHELGTYDMISDT